jgi:uncharacterized membrane protein (Fun14 family)
MALTMNALFTKLRVATEASAANVIGQNPPWKAKTIWLALMVTLLGGGLWVKDHRSPPPPSTDGLEFTARGTVIQPEVHPVPPATFRFGASYIGGFFLGWTLRRFLKFTLLAAGAAIFLISLGKKLGWFELDWNSLETQVRQSLAWLTGEAGAFKHFLTGYLPSAGAAGVGGFLGFRRK